MDLQRDFLTHGGFLKRPASLEPLLEPLSILLDAAREAGHAVIWVTSEHPERAQPPAPLRPERPQDARYQALPMNNDRLASGHAGRPCCAPGSDGALLHPLAQALVRPADQRLVKARYSAFGETGLAERLRQAQVEEIFICGVLTSTSVRASAVDAFFLGFDVTIVADATADARRSDHRDALEQLGRGYGRVEAHVGALTRWSSVRRGLGAGDTEVHYGVLAPELDARAFADARDEIDWQQLRHRGGVVPRLVCLQGDIAPDGTIPIYRHPADEQPTLGGWTPTIDALRQVVMARTGQHVNHALIQRYTGGADHISAHADKTLDITRGSAILGLSLGATRTIALRAKTPSPDGTHEVQRLELPHGSIFALGWQTNQAYQHGIAPDRRQAMERRADELRDDSHRISLTMRSVATFLTPDGQLYGQGARRKARDADAPAPQPAREQAERMVTAFGLENQRADFDWERYYGEGFDVLDLASLREGVEGEA